jgi:hypothetical protein
MFEARDPLLIQPSLYLQNLPEKMQKQDLRLSLYMLFATYGPVLDVVAMKSAKMRGQAHIVFRDIQASTQAMRALQGFEFFGKEMVGLLRLLSADAKTVQKIQYGKGRSDVFTRLEGVYKPPSVATTTTATDLQQSIFNATPSTLPTAGSAPGQLRAPAAVTNGSKSEDEGPQGVKRRREDESDAEEAPMEEDDDDVSMEASSDDE